jgi:hypothetical protein
LKSSEKTAARKTVRVSEAEFLDSLGAYSRKKSQTGLVELLRKGKDKFAKSLDAGKTMEYIVADANHALKMHSSNPNVAVTVEDMTEALGGTAAVDEIVRTGQLRRQAAKAKRDKAKAARAAAGAAPPQAVQQPRETTGDRHKHVGAQPRTSPGTKSGTG